MSASPVRTLIGIPPGPLGVTLGDTWGPNGGYLIAAVNTQTCPVQGQLSVGDEIVAVDGTDLTQASSKTVVLQSLRESSKRHRFLVVVTKEHRYRTSIPLPAGPLGVTMSQQLGPYGGRLVEVVKNNCPVPNLIAVGDEVVGVDTMDLTQVAKVEFLKALRESANRDRFLIIIRQGAEEDMNRTMNTLNITRQETQQQQSSTASAAADEEEQHSDQNNQTLIGVPPGPLGLTLGDSQGPNGGYLVHAIRPSCAIQGQISIGDEVLAVDQTSLTHLTDKNTCVQLLRATSNRNRVLVIARPGAISQRHVLSREESASMIDALASIFGTTCSTTAASSATAPVEDEETLIPPTPTAAAASFSSSAGSPAVAVATPVMTSDPPSSSFRSAVATSTTNPDSFRSTASEAPVIGTRVLIGVPPGPLGLNLSERTGPNGGHLVEIVKANCPFASQVAVGDELITLDHTDLANHQPLTDVVNTLRLSAGRDRVLVVVRVTGAEHLSGKDV